jgi:transcriptional regulator with XRE-family HTH domain
MLPRRRRGVFKNVLRCSRGAKGCDIIACMDDNTGNSAASHFGRQVVKARLARHWTMRELSRRSGIDPGYLSRVETGKRAPSLKVAAKLDQVFPERDGWFSDWAGESRNWSEVPPSFKGWAEIEARATRLSVWSPGVVDGLLQTADYARAWLRTLPGVTDEVLAARLQARVERQRRILFRDDPPTASFVVDELSLYRMAGSPEVMAAQMGHLLKVASLPHVTLQMLPAVANPASSSELIITESAAYVEHLTGGLVYTDAESVTPLLRLFTTIHSESNKASETLAAIERLGELWTGGSPLIQTLRAARA